MPRRRYIFDPPERFVAGTVGEPGERTFFLQARDGGRVVSVVLEKVQVAVLADRLNRLLDELDQRGVTVVTPLLAETTPDAEPLDEPIVEAFDAYWVPLGWSKEAPILTQSRIDVPRSGAGVNAGRAVIAGVAWAPDRGISRVEVAVDGAWRDATLSNPISPATWVQWRADWDAASGSHTIMVRATDGRGEVQAEQETPPAPDGARGFHTISVSVA